MTKDNVDDPKPNRWNAIPGEKELHDLDFDFEKYFDDHSAGNLNESEKEEFSARIFGLFCSTFFKSGGNPAAIPAWVANYVALRLFEGLQGRPWPDAMKLPWDEPTLWLTPKGQRAMNIYCAIANRQKSEPNSNITDLIAWQANEMSVSYETARADYYVMRKAIEWKQGIPEKFLNRDDGF